MNSNQPSWQILKDWEKELSSQLKIPIKKETIFSRFLKFRFEAIGCGKFLSFLTFKKNKISLRFIMTARSRKSVFITKNTIPVIIDFWLEENDLQGFYDSYKECPLVLITSMDVYNFLKENDCPLPIEHWPLSYPDKYGLKRNIIRKKYDFCLLGRPNPFFIRMLDEYTKRHPDFIYIKNNGEPLNRVYVTNAGAFVAKDSGRESYIEMIKNTKISCYSTPGIDESKNSTNRFNQVTPRLFEMLCNQCMVIGHYPNTPDVNWYNLKEIIPNVDNYDEFEKILNEMLSKAFEYEKIDNFVSRHYTSTRAKMLEEILEKYNIKICRSKLSKEHDNHKDTV